MRNQKAPLSFSPHVSFQGDEMRRRIADCRERLRRGRAARRIAGRESSPAEILPAEGAEMVGASAKSGGLKEKT
jgi:hypothetical protein